MRILFLIARQFKILLLVKRLRTQGYDHKFIASKAGIPEFAVMIEGKIDIRQRLSLNALRRVHYQNRSVACRKTSGKWEPQFR